MNQSEFTSLADQMFDSMRKLLVIKGGEYAGNEDRLGNFKRGAALVGCTPLQVAFIYASKHYDSIATYVRDMAAGEDRERSEAMEGRFDDLANYCLLMKAIMVEGKSAHVSNETVTHVSTVELLEIEQRPEETMDSLMLRINAERKVRGWTLIKSDGSPMDIHP